MNASHEYLARMSRDELPPPRAFWPVTLHDTDDGCFIPKDLKKYSVGANSVELDDGEPQDPCRSCATARWPSKST